MRSIQHPGTPSAVRVCAVAATTRQIEIDLLPGRSFLQAVHTALAPFGASSAVLKLQGGAFFPMAYALPALSKTPEHAVYFSDRLDAPQPVSIECASVTYGQRDGQPWLHCHAAWTQSDGRRCCGHVLPEQTHILQTIRASACLIDGAQFQVRPDAETHFSLFKPEAVDTKSNASSAPTSWIVQLAPNVDICSAIEDLCREHGVAQASLCGGVGSLVGAVFDDDRVVEPFVTEVLIRSGGVLSDAQGNPHAQIDVSLVDFTGGVHQGRLQRGANPVLVTFEMVLIPY
jgi:predicted DNA-binding protein with PD1-like motif